MIISPGNYSMYFTVRSLVMVSRPTATVVRSRDDSIAPARAGLAADGSQAQEEQDGRQGPQHGIDRMARECSVLVKSVRFLDKGLELDGWISWSKGSCWISAGQYPRSGTHQAHL